MENSYSIVEYYSQQTTRECGYCNGESTYANHDVLDVSVGMWAHSLTVKDYQQLIDRGWRRSGCYCYKPTMDQTCCPMYTIRCDALEFKITKSQKKILKKMGKFLRDELKRDSQMEDDSMQRLGNGHDHTDTSNMTVLYEDLSGNAEMDPSEIKVMAVERDIVEKKVEISKDDKSSDVASCSRVEKSDVLRNCKEIKSTPVTLSRDKCTAADAVNRPPPKKAKLIRAERKLKKLAAQGKTPQEIDALLRANKQNNCNIKTIEDLFDEMTIGSVHKLEIKLVRVRSAEFYETFEVCANLYKKYQMTVHKSEAHTCDDNSFFNFLVKSPLQPYSPVDGPPQGYGSFHEQYWLDGKLIAVAVIDILPSCVSSVYFFYDPDYSFLSLGTFSSLHEVLLTRQLYKASANLKYYYMGFYIHSTVKMRYKAKIKPSKLLCPETYVWCDIESSIAKIDKNKYSRLNDDIDAIDENGIVDLNKVMVLYRQAPITYENYKKAKPTTSSKDDSIVEEYASLVGTKCYAHNMLLYRK